MAQNVIVIALLHWCSKTWHYSMTDVLLYIISWVWMIGRNIQKLKSNYDMCILYTVSKTSKEREPVLIKVQNWNMGLTNKLSHSCKSHDFPCFDIYEQQTYMSPYSQCLWEYKHVQKYLATFDTYCMFQVPPSQM